MRDFLRLVYLICFLVVIYVLCLMADREQGLNEQELAECMDYSELKQAQTLEFHDELETLRKVLEKEVPRKKRFIFRNIAEDEREKLKENIAQTAQELREDAAAQLERPVPPIFLREDGKMKASTYEIRNMEEYFAAQDRQKTEDPEAEEKEYRSGKAEYSRRSVYAGNWKYLNPMQSAWIGHLSEKKRNKTPVLERPFGDSMEAPALLSAVHAGETQQEYSKSGLTGFKEIGFEDAASEEMGVQTENESSASTLDSVLDDAVEQEAQEGEDPPVQEAGRGNFPKKSGGENLPNALPKENTSGIAEPYDHSEGLRTLRYFNQLAKKRLETYDQEIRDYSCILYKWDGTNTAVDGKDVMEIKLREEPYSIYARTLYPKKFSGREWLYWSGHYQDELLVYGGPKLPKTLSVKLDSAAVRNYSTRSVMQMGFRRLLEELVELSNDESLFQHSVIQYFGEAKVGDRNCQALQITFLKPHVVGEDDFYRIQIYVDQELQLPIHLIIYDWPEMGMEPKIRESYLYVIREMNPGFTDEDFCHLNPEYSFSTFLPRMKNEVEQLKQEFQFPDKGK